MLADIQAGRKVTDKPAVEPSEFGAMVSSLEQNLKAQKF